MYLSHNASCFQLHMFAWSGLNAAVVDVVTVLVVTSELSLLKIPWNLT